MEKDVTDIVYNGTMDAVRKASMEKFIKGDITDVQVDSIGGIIMALAQVMVATVLSNEEAAKNEDRFVDDVTGTVRDGYIKMKERLAGDPLYKLIKKLGDKNETIGKPNKSTIDDVLSTLRSQLNFEEQLKKRNGENYPGDAG